MLLACAPLSARADKAPDKVIPALTTSDCRNFEPDAGRGDSALAIYSRQRCFNGSMVALPTWVVMPLVTRAFDGWLHPNERKPSA